MKWSLCAFFLFSMNSFASMSMNEFLRDSEVNENTSYFDKLGDLYAKGTLPKIEKTANTLWAGRCFKSDNPSIPLGAFYYIRSKQDSEAGPLGRDVVSYEAITSSNRVSNFYDNKTIEEILKTVKNFFPTKSSLNSLDTKSGETWSSLRRSEAYLVEEYFKLTGSDFGPIGPELKRDISFRCYYFLPPVQDLIQ